jgi:hypothetical protein
MSDSPVVRDPEDEGPLGALTPEARQRLPDSDHDLLEQVFAFPESLCVAGGKTPECRAMRFQD